MKDLIFFCTHIINRAIISEYKKLKNSYPEKFDVILVINNEVTKLDYNHGLHELTFFDEPVKCLLFDKALNDKLGLACMYNRKISSFSKTMWYNGDYRYYYVRHFLPDYAYYWYIEYDVYCNGKSYKPFLLRYESRTEDLLIKDFSTPPKALNWKWKDDSDWVYDPQKLAGSFFPLSRLSARAVDYLYERRKEHIKLFESSRVPRKRWIFCELFVPTEIVLANFSADTIDEEFIQQGTIDLNENRIFESPDDKIYHPIKFLSEELKGKYNKIHSFHFGKYRFVIERKKDI